MKYVGLFLCLFFSKCEAQSWDFKKQSSHDTIYHSVVYYEGTNKLKREVIARGGFWASFVNGYRKTGRMEYHYFLYSMDTIISHEHDSLGDFDIYQLVLTYSGFEYSKHGKINGWTKVEKGIIMESHKNLMWRPRKKRYLESITLIAA